MIREAVARDAEAIARIYNHYIRNTIITFEETAITSADTLKRIHRVQTAGFSWLVAKERGKIIGYAYSAPWNHRAGYRYTAEVSVYLADTATARGWGTKLYTKLFSSLRQKSMHIVIGGITLPNPASVAIHEKFGMEKVAHFKEVGYKFGRRLDVGYWQINLNARQ